MLKEYLSIFENSNIQPINEIKHERYKQVMKWKRSGREDNYSDDSYYEKKRAHRIERNSEMPIPGVALTDNAKQKLNFKESLTPLHFPTMTLTTMVQYKILDKSNLNDQLNRLLNLSIPYIDQFINGDFVYKLPKLVTSEKIPALSQKIVLCTDLMFYLYKGISFPMSLTFKGVNEPTGDRLCFLLGLGGGKDFAIKTRNGCITYHLKDLKIMVNSAQNADNENLYMIRIIAGGNMVLKIYSDISKADDFTIYSNIVNIDSANKIVKYLHDNLDQLINDSQITYSIIPIEKVKKIVKNLILSDKFTNSKNLYTADSNCEDNMKSTKNKFSKDYSVITVKFLPSEFNESEVAKYFNDNSPIKGNPLTKHDVIFDPAHTKLTINIK